MTAIVVGGRDAEPRYSAARARSLAAVLHRIHDGACFRERFDLAAFINGSGNALAPIHRWLRYREAYSPQLIAKLGLGDRILDPFCGCGSILVGAAQHGFTSAGIDVNPLATFAARVKLTPLSGRQLRSIREFIDNLETRMAGAEPWPAPSLGIAGRVFEPDILESLLRIRSLIEEEFCGDRDCQDFLHLAWVAILEQVGSYFKEGNGIKYRNRKRLKTGYVRREEGRWQRERFGDDQRRFVVGKFLAQARMMVEDARWWKKGRWRDQVVIEGNVLDMDELLGRRRFHSIVFSPPYANRFDYFESMKVELWFGGFVDSYEAIHRLRKASLRSHLGADLKRAYDEFEPLERLIDLMDREASSWRMGVPDLLRGYFDDMRTTLRQCRKVLAGGRCFIVVGNSAFAGVIVPTDALLARLGLECGFTRAEILVARHLGVAPQQRVQLGSMEEHMRESVVVLS
jgi:site-specific DNA-methyltransferase (adenine-specific)